ncbi:MAG: FMN-binding protein [Tissierella sp.]|nr:FMN-binding protein [Tissierella sp.]
MKRFLTLGLILTLVLTITVGCSTTEEAKYTDGTYTAESEVDDRGYKSVIEIVVENGEITSVDYDEFNEEGARKSEDEAYAENMKGVSGVAPAEAYEQMEEALIKRQNVDEVELVSGATSSAEMFKTLAKEALNE